MPTQPLGNLQFHPRSASGASNLKPFGKPLKFNQQTYEQLKLALNLNLRRQVFIAVCDDLVLRDRLAAQLQAEVAAQTAVSVPLPADLQAVKPYPGAARIYPRLVSLKLDLRDPNPMRQVVRWLAQSPLDKSDRHKVQMPAFQVLGVELLTRQPAAVQRLFLSYLEGVERNLSLLDSSLLLWMPRPWFRALPHSAPGFWRCRSRVFEFEGEPTPLPSHTPTAASDPNPVESDAVSAVLEPSAEQHRTEETATDLWSILTHDLAQLDQNSFEPFTSATVTEAPAQPSGQNLPLSQDWSPSLDNSLDNNVPPASDQASDLADLPDPQSFTSHPASEPAMEPSVNPAEELPTETIPADTVPADTVPAETIQEPVEERSPDPEYYDSLPGDFPFDLNALLSQTPMATAELLEQLFEHRSEQVVPPDPFETELEWEFPDDDLSGLINLNRTELTEVQPLSPTFEVASPAVEGEIGVETAAEPKAEADEPEAADPEIETPEASADDLSAAAVMSAQIVAAESVDEDELDAAIGDFLSNEASIFELPEGDLYEGYLYDGDSYSSGLYDGGLYDGDFYEVEARAIAPAQEQLQPSETALNPAAEVESEPSLDAEAPNAEILDASFETSASLEPQVPDTVSDSDVLNSEALALPEADPRSETDLSELELLDRIAAATQSDTITATDDFAELDLDETPDLDVLSESLYAEEYEEYLEDLEALGETEALPPAEPEARAETAATDDLSELQEEDAFDTTEPEPEAFDASLENFFGDEIETVERLEAESPSPDEGGTAAVSTVDLTAAEDLSEPEFEVIDAFDETPEVSESLSGETSETLEIRDAEILPLTSADSQAESLLLQIDLLRQQNVHPSAIANAYHTLGNYYCHLIEQGDASPQILSAAIKAYEQTLQLLPETADIRTDVYNDIGNLYWMRSRQAQHQEQAQDDLLQSIAAYQLALDKINLQASPQTYSMVQNNLGAAWGDLARYRDPTESLRQSMQAYQRALRYRDPEADPIRYASTQNNLGTTCWNLAQHQAPVVFLKQAIAAYGEALRYYHPEQEPLSYAMIQNNLGTAYWNLSQHETPKEWLMLALGSYRMALRYRTLEASPAGFAATQNNLGTAYFHMAAHTKEEPEEQMKYLREAIAAYEATLRAATHLLHQTPPQVAALSFDVFATYNNLGLVHYRVATGGQATEEVGDRLHHLKMALNNHLQAVEGWQTNESLRQAAMNGVLQTIRTIYEYSGWPGQNEALAQVPPALLSEVLSGL